MPSPGQFVNFTGGKSDKQRGFVGSEPEPKVYLPGTVPRDGCISAR